MKSKWLVALAVLFLAASACICGTSDEELSGAVSDLADASTELKEAVDDAMGNEEELDDEEPIEEVELEPEVYTCDYINEQRKDLTELQWDEYTKSLVGKRIKYEGEITEVYDDGRIQIDACSGILSGGPFIIYGTPIDVAIQFSKDQFIKGEGTIKEAGTFIFMYIHVHGETIE